MIKEVKQTQEITIKHKYCDDCGIEIKRDMACSVAKCEICGKEPLPQYKHPERAFYIFGAEDATLGKRVTDWCRDIIYIPTERCMNLAATVNVVLYDRLSKSRYNGERNLPPKRTDKT